MSVILSHISKKYGSKEVLHNISFELHPGEIVSFLGPNGAGKSTCLNIITGWIVPNQGNVFVCGYNIAKDSLPAKSKIGYLPEDNPLYPELYVREYLEFVAGTYKVPNPKERIAEIAEMLKLEDSLGKIIGTLSKGYKQRVGLAQALIHDPEVLLLDEPFSGFDPNQLEEVHSLIKKLGKEKTILFSSHSLAEVTDLSDKTIIISQGQIVADSSIAELTKEKPLDEIFKELTR